MLDHQESVLGYTGFPDVLADLLVYVANLLGGFLAGLKVFDDVLAGIAGVLDRFPGFSVGAGGSKLSE